MAVVARQIATRKRVPSKSSDIPSAPVPDRTHHYPEAPDRGERDHEAPELRRDGRLGEAPDAGEGRMEIAEHEFTQGRSRS